MYITIKVSPTRPFYPLFLQLGYQITNILPIVDPPSCLRAPRLGWGGLEFFWNLVDILTPDFYTSDEYTPVNLGLPSNTDYMCVIWVKWLAARFNGNRSASQSSWIVAVPLAFDARIKPGLIVPVTVSRADMWSRWRWWSLNNSYSLSSLSLSLTLP